MSADSVAAGGLERPANGHDEPVLALRDARGIHAVVFLDAVRLATTND